MTPTQARRQAAWQVALTAARRDCSGIFDPAADPCDRDMDDAIETVAAVVRTRRGEPDMPADRPAWEYSTGAEAGYLFALALTAVLDGPWYKFIVEPDADGAR